MVYGAAVPALTDQITGFVNGQNSSVVTGAPTITTTATSTSTVAGSPYPITITAGTLSAPNYSFTTLINGLLTVTPAPLTVTANNASMVYGASVPAFTDQITGFVNGQNSSVVTGAPHHDDRHVRRVRSPAVPTRSRSRPARSRLPITRSQPSAMAPLTVNPAPLTVTASNAVHGLRRLGAGTHRSDHRLRQRPEYQRRHRCGDHLDHRHLHQHGGRRSLHRSRSRPARSRPRITRSQPSTTVRSPSPRRRLTVTANNASMVYGASVPALTDQITGFVNGQNSSVVTGAATITTTATSTSTVAGSPYTDHDRRRHALGSQLQVHNLRSTVFSPSRRRPLTVTANNASMVYGASVPALTDLITGFVNGQNSSVVTGAATITTTATSTSTVAGSPYTDHDRGRHALGSQLLVHEIRQRSPHRHPGALDGHREQRLHGLRRSGAGTHRSDHRLRQRPE